MRQHRIFVKALHPEVMLNSRETHHLLNVLRVKQGQKLLAFNGEGLEAEAEVLAIDGTKLLLRLGEVKASEVESPWRLTLAVALLKGDKLADVVRQGTELGVAAFIPIVSQYCEVREFKEGKRLRLERIAQEASKQCGRSFIPPIHPLHHLHELKPQSLNLIAHPYSQTSLAEALSLHQAHQGLDILCLTGPEGGFGPKDMDTIDKCFQEKILAIQLGRRILRAETAPVALAAAILVAQGF